MYNLNKQNIIQDEFGRPLNFFEKVKLKLQNKLATIDFNKIKNNLGPSTLFAAKTLGKWLVNAFKIIYKYLPTLCIFLLLGYLLIQAGLFIVNNLIPFCSSNFNGFSEFTNKLPYAFHTDLNGWIKFGRFILFFSLLFILQFFTEIVSTNLEYNEYPDWLSYLVVLATGLFIISLFLPIWFNWLCGITSIIVIGKLLIENYTGSDYSLTRSSRSGSSDNYEERITKLEKSQNTSTFQEVQRTYKFENVRQYNTFVGAIRRLYENGKNTGTGTSINMPGKLISASGDQIIVQQGSQWYTYEAQTGNRVSSCPAPN